jgi:protein-S-isoprenylcysteine O-methyltransferase Ste14
MLGAAGSITPKNPLLAVLFWVSIGVLLVVELRAGGRQRAGATDADDGSRNVLLVTLVTGYIVGLAAARNIPAASFPRSNLVVIAGLVLIWAGLGLRQWAVASLGEYFTFTVMTSETQPVVQSGPYRVVRHPGYTGAVVTRLGLALVFGNWVAFAAFTLIPLIGVVNRIRVEERALTAQLGSAYTDYASTHKRLLPFIW